MTGPRIFFYVQYLQGVGHLYRALHIARAMTDAGLCVDLVSGGMPIPGLDVAGINFHQLTPIKCRDGDFSDLIDEHGQSLNGPFKDRRRDELLSLYVRLQPAAIVVEAFPFGRRQMRFELLPLLDQAQSASPIPVIISSVRDVLQISDKPERARQTVDYISQYFDRVLVHGDPEFVSFDETFPCTENFSNKIHYTGLVAKPADACVGAKTSGGEVLVSAGGGGTKSEKLLGTAIKARALSSAKDLPWRLLAGPNLPAEEFEKLAADLPTGITLEPNRGDFPHLLAQCAVSVSQAGYNTVIDLLRTGCRAVIVPYSARGETEQLFRARRLKKMGLVQLVEDEDLSPRSLALAIDTALKTQPPELPGIDLRGAEKSASLVSQWLKE